MDTQPTAEAKGGTGLQPDLQPVRVQLIAGRYGKSRVRLMTLSRIGAHHEIREVTDQILLEGDIESSDNAGDNSKVLPTDTMKNTVYALAKREGLTSIEGFGKAL